MGGFERAVKPKKGLAIVIGGHDEPDGDEGDDMGMEADEAELDAYKAMESAKSPEEGAKALKAFIKLCTSAGDY